MCDAIRCGSSAADGPLPAIADGERRQFIKGLAALPLATVLAYPDLARAAAGRLEALSLKTPSGHAADGMVALPEKIPAPAVLLIHEWWGLNDQIKAVAADLAKQGYIALAVDLYNGKVATTRERAHALRLTVEPDVATEQLTTFIDWLRKHDKGTGKVGTIGWCFGGSWSLNASLATPVDATVIYYGNVTQSADQLKSLAGPVMGHFGTKDRRINTTMVGNFEREMKTAGKSDLAVHWYVADHAFANPTGSRYDAEDAALAWSRTLAFLQKTLW